MVESNAKTNGPIDNTFHLYQVLVESRLTLSPGAFSNSEVGLIHQAIVEALGDLGYILQIYDVVCEEPGGSSTQVWMVVAKSFGEAFEIVGGTPVFETETMKITRIFRLEECYANPSWKTPFRRPRPGNLFERLLQKITSQQALEILDDSAPLSTAEQLIFAYTIFSWADEADRQKQCANYDVNRQERWNKFTSVVNAIANEKKALQAVADAGRALFNARALLKEFYIDVNDLEAGPDKN